MMETQTKIKHEEDIMQCIKEHYTEAHNYFDDNQIIGIFLHGSQNYNLDTKYSDIDTKLLVTPSLDSIIFNKSPASTTHVRENNEHIDFKDIRLWLQSLKKQNMNFLEILFTPYFIVNDMYKEIWKELVLVREAIARYDIITSIKAMKGIALQKAHALTHRYPTKIDIIDTFGYDPKQLHHILRIDEFMKRYIEGEPYEKCLISNSSEELKKVKLGAYTFTDAKILAQDALCHIDDMVNLVVVEHAKNPEKYKVNEDIERFLSNAQKDFILKSITKELQFI